jgi:toxin ParE1/3/4
MKVIFAQTALDDLTHYFVYLCAQTDLAFAAAYIAKIQDFCETLSQNPERGTQRKIGGRQFRFIVYRRRIVVAYSVDDGVVTIISVLMKGQAAPTS